MDVERLRRPGQDHPFAEVFGPDFLAQVAADERLLGQQEDGGVEGEEREEEPAPDRGAEEDDEGADGQPDPEEGLGELPQILLEAGLGRAVTEYLGAATRQAQLQRAAEVGR